MFSREGLAFCQLTLQQRPESLLHRDVHGLGKGIAEHGNAHGVRRFCLSVLAVALTVAVDTHVRPALSLIMAFDAGSEGKAAIVIRGVKKRIRIANHPQKYFAEQQAKQETK